MKHIVLAATLSVFALTGCSGIQNPFSKTTEAKPMVKHEKGDHHDKEHGERKPMHHKHHHHDAAFNYKCEQKAMLSVKYDSENDMADLNVTAPTLGLKDADIQVQLAPSASGERYVNDTNPASIYEWHTKGYEGNFSVTVNNKEYSLSCEAIKPANHP